MARWACQSWEVPWGHWIGRVVPIICDSQKHYWNWLKLGLGFHWSSSDPWWFGTCVTQFSLQVIAAKVSLPVSLLHTSQFGVLFSVELLSVMGQSPVISSNGLYFFEEVRFTVIHREVCGLWYWQVSILILSITFIRKETLGESVSIFKSYLKIASNISTYRMDRLRIKTGNFCKTVTKVLKCNMYCNYDYDIKIGACISKSKTFSYLTWQQGTFGAKIWKLLGNC